MSPVKAADPAAQSLDAAFASAMMDAPPKPREPAPPDEIDPDAPFGRDDAGVANAPHGLTKEGKPRRSAAGRKPKDEQPRTAAAVEGTAGPGHEADAVEGHDYTSALAEFGDAVWFGLSALGKGGSAIPLIGKRIPERKVAAQAQVFASFKPNLVKAVNLAAQHNRKAARFAAGIETGDITWVAMVGFMVMPFMTMSAAIWQGDEALARAELPSIAQLGAKNDEQLDAYLKNISDQMEALQAQINAEALAAINAQLDTETAQALAQAQEAGIL
jgi:hypothetical protein